MRKINLKRLTLAAMLLAVGMILPTITMSIKEIGDTLLPMHMPVMLCGFLCGPWYGLVVGLMLPFLRSLTVGMPPLYPNAVWMALELATYGLVIGLLYLKKKNKGRMYLFFCLVISMLSGRIVWGISKATLLGIGGKAFTMSAFVVGGFVDAIPGIILQLILIPLIVGLYEDTKIKTSKRKENEKC